MKSSPDKIKFYHKGKPYFEFTNFAQVSFTINELPEDLNLSPHLVGNWKTSEHLFQAAKFTDPNIIETIRQAPDEGFKSRGGVFWLANSKDGKYKHSIRGDWFSISLEVMYWVVKQKFLQNEWLKNKLLATGKKTLIEASEGNDNFWGQDSYGKGANNLGKILERLRDEISENQNPDPIPTNSPTNNIKSSTNNSSFSTSPAVDNKQNSNVKQAQQKAWQQIHKLFTENKVKPNELASDLWKNKSDWEEHLKELKTNQKIANFVQLMSEKIKARCYSKQKKDPLLSLDSPNKSNQLLFWLLGSGILLLILLIFFFIKKKVKVRMMKKKFNK